jgi:hypothetical protein
MLAPAGKALVESSSFGLSDSNGCLKARRAHTFHPMSGNGGIGVDRGGDDTRKSGSN